MSWVVGRLQDVSSRCLLVRDLQDKKSKRNRIQRTNFVLNDRCLRGMAYMAPGSENYTLDRSQFHIPHKEYIFRHSETRNSPGNEQAHMSN